jgi:glucosyl-3-phosphoglycerate synthase
VAAERAESISVCLPARNEAPTIGPILEAILPLKDEGVIDQVIVLDDSTDATAAIARRLGAEVHCQSHLRPEFGPVCGKGDAMWRGLSVARGDVIVFLDADSEQVGPHYVLGLVGPIVCEGASFTKAYYRRPFRMGNVEMSEGGGRVTELMARPLLDRFYPELSSVHQPLAGEIAARRGVLEQISFTTGYGVDIGLLIDALNKVGPEGLAQVDIEVRQNQHQPLSALRPMAAAVLASVLQRAARDGRLEGGTWLPEPAEERPAAAALPLVA